MTDLYITLAQINTSAGNLSKNTLKIIEAIENAKTAGSDIIVFPELCISGYTSSDLWLREEVILSSRAHIDMIRQHTNNITVIVGSIDKINQSLYDCAFVIQDQQIIAKHYKRTLPKSDLFEEQRYFSVGHEETVVTIKGYKLGIAICEDLQDQIFTKPCDLYCTLNALTFTRNSAAERDELLGKFSLKHQTPLIFVNALAGQDTLILDGSSSVFNAKGQKILQLPSFREATMQISLQHIRTAAPVTPTTVQSAELIYDAICFSLKDFFHKNNYKKVLIPLSQHPASALLLVLAADALGADRIHAIALTDQTTPYELIQTHKTTCTILGVDFRCLPLTELLQQALKIVQPHFFLNPTQLTLETLQRRLATQIILALDENHHHLLLSCNNKTDLAVGNAILHGDLSGDFCPLADIYASEIASLIQYINTHEPIIPELFTQSPSEITLYGDLNVYTLNSHFIDDIIRRHVELGQSTEEIMALGYEEHLVVDVINKIHHQQYLRKQAPIGPKLTHFSLIHDWRTPVTSGWKLVPKGQVTQPAEIVINKI